MERDKVGPRADKAGDIGLRIVDHQMDIEGNLDAAAKVLELVGSEGDIRDEMTVHNVDMKPVGAGFFDSLKISSERRKICGKHG